MSDSLRPRGLQHATFPVHHHSWNMLKLMSIRLVMHPTISSFVILFSCLQFFPPSGSLLRCQFFILGGQSIGASASVLSMNIQDWFPLGWTGWISWPSRDSQDSFPTLQFKSINSLVLDFLYSPSLTSIYPYTTTGKPIAWTRWTFVGKVMSLPFNMLSRLVVTFLSRSKYLPSSSSMAAITIWSGFGGP